MHRSVARRCASSGMARFLKRRMSWTAVHALYHFQHQTICSLTKWCCFPRCPTSMDLKRKLVAEIRVFIHAHVDVSPLFETIASYYVLFSWLYDCFNELPYLRVRGDTGSGKGLDVFRPSVSVCYKPIFASGASTVSPIFRILDSFQGTLIIDEADFRASDEKAEITKILNNGNARGFPGAAQRIAERKGIRSPSIQRVRSEDDRHSTIL